MPLFWLSLAFLSGVLAAHRLPGVEGPVWLLAGGGFLAAAFFESRLLSGLPGYQKLRSILRLPLFLLAAGVLAGGARYQYSQPNTDPSRLAYYNGGGIYQLTGVIISYPDRRSEVEYLHIRVDRLAQISDGNISPEVSVTGRLRARIRYPQENEWRYGDRVILTGKLLTPPEGEGFSYRDYLAGQRIFSIIYPDEITLLSHDQAGRILGMLYSFREHAYKVLNQLLPQPEAGLLSGILLGIENDLSDPIQEAFQDSGTYHIIAISGFNIAIIAGLFMSLSGQLLPKRWALPAALLGISCYTLLVGAQASVVRAAIMGAAGLLGRHIGRKQVGLNSLAFTAGIMCFGNPRVPWDAGFQLSFSATLGLVLFGNRLQDWFEKFSEERFGEEVSRRLSGPVSETILFTLAAQVTTAPVLLIHFQRLSISALLANPLILPPQPLVMILGGVAVLSGILFQPIGQLLAYLVWPLLAYTIAVAEWAASIPGGVLLTGRAGIVFALFYYGILFGLFFVNRIPKVNIMLAKPGILVTACLAACAVWRLVLSLPDGRLHYLMYNLGDESFFLIQTPKGHAVLINGRGDADRLAEALGSRMKPANGTIDALVLTNSARGGSLLGLYETLQRYPVGTAFSQDSILDDADNQPIKTLLEDQKAATIRLVPGQRLDLGGGASMQMVASSSKGTAVLLEWERLRILVPDQVPLDAIRCAVPQKLDSLSGLVLSRDDLNGTPLGDWAALNPAVLLFDGWQAGEDHPFNTIPYQGADWVELETDGSRLWISVSS